MESRVQVVHLRVKDNYSQPHCIVSIVISEKDEMETSTMARFMCTFFIDTNVKFSTNLFNCSFQVFFSTIVVKTWNVKARMTTR